MAVAFDAATESGTWTTTPDPFTFTHTPAGTATWALLGICQAVAATDDIDGPVTFGGAAMSRVATDGVFLTEIGRVYWYFLAGSWSSVQTVSIGHTATANTKIATLITGTGTGPGVSNLAATNADGFSSVATSDQRLVTTTAAQRYVIAYSSVDAPASLVPLAGMTAVSDHDFTNDICRVDRETTTSTDFTIGYSTTTVGIAQAAVAIEEGPATPVPTLYRYNWENQATAHVGTYPVLEADDLLIGIFESNGGHTVTTPTDWAILAAFDGTGGTMSSGVFYKEATGSEADTFDFLLNVSTNGQALLHLWHIPAAIRDITVPPEITAVGPTASGTPDPGSLTPSWGSAATIWFVDVTRDNSDGISSLGADYDLTFVYDPTLSATIEQASAWRINTAASEDPPASTVGSTDEEFKAYTIGVKPAASGDVTGSGASTLDGVTSAGSGTFTPPAITGTGSSTLDGVTSAGAGTYTPAAITGAGASLLDGVTSTGSGTFAPPGITGTGASTLDGVASAGSGTFIGAITGTGASTLAGVTSIGAGFFGDIFLPGITCETLTLGVACEITVLPVACAILSLGVECEQ